MSEMDRLIARVILCVLLSMSILIASALLWIKGDSGGSLAGCGLKE